MKIVIKIGKWNNTAKNDNIQNIQNHHSNQCNYEEEFELFFPKYFANNYISVISNLFYGMYNSMMTVFKCNTISNSESERYYLQMDDPKFDGEKANLTFEIPNTREIAYIKVLALVNFISIKEYFLYKSCDINSSDISNDNSSNYSKTPSDNKNNNKTLIWIIVGISGELFIIVITITIIIVKKKEMKIS